MPLNNTLKHDVEITDDEASEVVVQDEHDQDVDDLDGVFETLYEIHTNDFKNHHVNTSIFFYNRKTREIISKVNKKLVFKSISREKKTRIFFSLSLFTTKKLVKSLQK